MNTDRAYFGRIYAAGPDPWAFASSWYEQRKYAITMASLPRPRYGSAFEPGCSIGVLTEALAARCDRLLAMEIVPTAFDQARNRLRPQHHVCVQRAAIPEDWPPGCFDLIVLSEIAYYFDEATLSEIAKRVVGSLSGGGTLVGVHWRGETDYPLTGDAAQEILGASRSLEHVVGHREAEFSLDVWCRSS